MTGDARRPTTGSMPHDLSKPSSFILWIQQPHPDRSKLRPPALLLTAAPESDWRRWRAANHWADQLPLISFLANEEAKRYPRALPFQVLPDPGSHIPAWIHGIDGWAPEVARPPTSSAAMWNVVDIAGQLARKVKGPTWEICAGGSEGLLACGAAAASGGWGVALETKSPSHVTAATVQALDLSMTVRETDVEVPGGYRERPIWVGYRGRA